MEQINEKFNFNTVATVFDAMAYSHIPNYAQMVGNIKMVCAAVSEQYKHPLSVLDIGCSTGNGLIAAHSVMPGNTVFKGCDVSEPMVGHAQQHAPFAEIACTDGVSMLSDGDDKYDVILLNYVLQFMPDITERAALLSMVHESLFHDGVLILSEKHRYNSTDTGWLEQSINKYNNDSYMRFRLNNGDTEEQYLNKTTRLKNMMTPHSYQEMVQLLNDAGFTRIHLLNSEYGFSQLVIQK